ncbi:MAG TPA: hypothetical protein VLL52_07280 [Anaerolineae bacterium]|nr:hypothetical protein [Anaerolineae bacterium]
MLNHKDWRYLFSYLAGLFLLASFLVASSAEAAIIRNYTVRFSANDSGDIILIGNKLSTCNTGISSCQNAINGVGTGGVLNNNNYEMVYVDIDGDGTTFNSSSADLTLPAGATVSWAGLYWGGDSLSTNTSINQMRFRVPGGSYTTVTATQVDTTTLGAPSGRVRYQGFANVTSLVQAAGQGTYFGANVQAVAGAGRTDSYAAWNLVIVYQDITQPLRNLTVFDGFANVTSADPSVNVAVSGFLTPLSGAVNAKLGLLVYEGDLGLTGDNVRLNGTLLSNSLNPSTNFFNSTISSFGSRVSSKNPDHINQMALDIDMLSINGLLANGATGATLTFNTTSDAYYPGMISFVTDIQAPRLEINKTVQDLNGGQVEPNDILQYTITLNNSGLDSASNVILTDNIPANTSYDPNSLEVITGANAGVKSDTAANDQAEYLTGPNRVVFRLGTGANGSVGGSLASSGTTSIRFRVRVTTPLANGTVITNQASVSYSAATSGQSFTTPSNPISVIVVSAPNLAITKRDSLLIDADFNGYPSPGDTLRYTVGLVNSGTANATGVTFNDTPGTYTSLVVGSVTTSQGSVVTGNSGGDTAVAVSVGTVAALGSATITFDVLIDAVVPAGVTQVVNQGRLTSNELPPVVTDDPDTGIANDATITPITAAPLLIARKTDSLFTDVDGNGVPSPGDVLSYTVTIRNVGNQLLNGVIFDDTPGTYTSLVVGSVTTSQGSVVLGNSGGHTAVRVNVGTLNGAGGTVTINFRVTIDGVVPATVNQVANQGVVSSATLPPLVTNDPDTSLPSDPTVTPITAAPLLVATKVANLANDADANGVPSPGDTLLYQIVILNNGNTAATQLIFQDIPDSNSSLQVGTVQTSQGTVLVGNTGGDTTVKVDLVSLPAQTQAVVSFEVLITTPLATGVTQIVNQGIVNSYELPALVTDDPATPPIGDPTIVPVTAAPHLLMDKTDLLWVDNDSDGVPSPGDILLYQLKIRNTGNSAATGVVFTDTPDVNTTLITGTVQSATGTIVTGNNKGDTTVRITLGTIPAGSQINIGFQVTVNSPLPAGVTQVSNQAVVRSNELPTVLSNDPDVPTPNSPTVTAVTAVPAATIYKTDRLWQDVDNNGSPSPGDHLLYQITVINTGQIALSNVTLTDMPDNNTSLILFTTQSSQGVVTSGNNIGDTAVGVNIGTIEGGGQVTIIFEVMINNPLPVGITQVANQAVVNSDELAHLRSDDPDTALIGDETITFVSSAPALQANKSYLLVNDADMSGQPSAGDSLRYTIQINNNGYGAATGVTFTDMPDANTTLITGTVQTGVGTVLVGNGNGDSSVSVDIGTIAGLSSVVIEFDVLIQNPLPGGVMQVANQGQVNSNELPMVVTDDPNTVLSNDPTITPVMAVPLLSATKRDSVLIDADNDGQASPGDTLLYTINIYSYGQTEATAVVFNDTVGTYSSLVVGSVGTTQGVVTTGNNGGDTAVAVTVGTIPVNQTVQISFEVLLDASVPVGVETVSNQGTVTATSIPSFNTNDPDTAPADDPTVTPLNAAPDLQIVKSDAGLNAIPSKTLTYTLSYSNTGSQDSSGVVISETIPANTTFNSGASDISWSCTGSAPGDVCTAAIGNLAVGASGQLLFVLNIDGMVSASSIRNVAEIGDDGSNGADLNYSDNSSSDDAAVGTPTAVTLHTATATKHEPIGNEPIVGLMMLLLGLTGLSLVARKQRLDL